MRASRAAITRCRRARRHPPWASAARVDTGIVGTPRPRLNPWATATAIRTPVKDPGPRLNAIASSCGRVRFRSSSKDSNMPRISSPCRRGARSRRWVMTPSASKAAEQASPEVSRPRIFIALLSTLARRLSIPPHSIQGYRFTGLIGRPSRARADALYFRIFARFSASATMPTRRPKTAVAEIRSSSSSALPLVSGDNEARRLWPCRSTSPMSPQTRSRP